VTNRISFLVTGLLVGASLTFGAQRVGPRPRPIASSTPATESSAAADEPAAVAAPSAASPELAFALAAVSQRLERIEQKLAVAAPATQQPAAAAEAEAALLKGVSPEERTPEEQQAFDRAESIIAGAVRAGVWADADQKAMRDTVAQLLEPDRFRLRMSLANAGNEGKLRDLAREPRFF
jgi:hypothetical protein